jgi:hypothetical protein
MRLPRQPHPPLLPLHLLQVKALQLPKQLLQTLKPDLRTGGAAAASCLLRQLTLLPASTATCVCGHDSISWCSGTGSTF